MGSRMTVTLGVEDKLSWDGEPNVAAQAVALQPWEQQHPVKNSYGQLPCACAGCAGMQRSSGERCVKLIPAQMAC